MKKVLYTMAMFSLVAMFAACGGNKEEAVTPKSEGERVGKMVCDCMKMAENEPEKAEECMKNAQKEYDKAVASFKGDEQKMKEFDEAGRRTAEKCMQ
jgi:hypothetical protein